MFGEVAAADLGLSTEGSYSKWDVYELRKGTTGDQKVAWGLLESIGCAIPPAKREKKLAPRRTETRIEVIPPKPRPETPRPRLQIDHSTDRETYVFEVVELLQANADIHREPIVIESEVSHLETVVPFLRATPLRTIIAVGSIEAAAMLAEELSRKLTTSKVDWWDHRRLQDDRRSPLLLANCENETSISASEMGFSVPAAVCHTCRFREGCTLVNGKKLAVKADHLVVAAGTLGFVSPDGFGDRDLIVSIGIEPGELLSTDGITTHAGELMDRLEQAGESMKLSTEDRIEHWSEKFATWHHRFFGSFLPSIRRMQGTEQQQYIPAGKPPLHATARLFAELQKQDAGVLPPGSTFRPILQAAEHQDVAVFLKDELRTSIEHDKSSRPIVSLVTKASRDDFQTLRPESTLRQPSNVVQHVLPLTKRDSPERYRKALRGVLGQHSAGSIIVVVHRRFRADIVKLAETEPRIVRVITFHEAAVVPLEADLIVCLGVPAVSDADVRLSLRVRDLCADLEFGPQILGLETAAGGMDDVPLMTYSTADAMLTHAELTRRKLGPILGKFTPPTVIISGHFLAIKLAANSLVPETEIVAAIRRILTAADGPVTARMIRLRLKSENLRLDRRNAGYYLQQVIESDSCLVRLYDGVSGIVRIRTHRHNILSNKNYSTGLYDGVSGIGKSWFTTSDFALSAGVTSRTARRQIQRMISAGQIESNNRPGKSIRYRLLETASTATELIEFETQFGERVVAQPPAEWNGTDDLFCRADLLKPQPEADSIEWDWGAALPSVVQ